MAMARPLRSEFPGAVYHVTARGNERRMVFVRDADRTLWLATLQEMAADFGVRAGAGAGAGSGLAFKHCADVRGRGWVGLNIVTSGLRLGASGVML